MNRTELIVNLQRPRKQRAYISMQERIIYEPFLIVDDGGWLCYETKEDFQSGNYQMCIPMDWAGKKDKNGVDVYEGDICELNNMPGWRGVVSSHNGCYLYVAKSSIADYLFKVLKEYSCKVIGNIFENPELIEQ